MYAEFSQWMTILERPRGSMTAEYTHSAYSVQGKKLKLTILTNQGLTAEAAKSEQYLNMRTKRFSCLSTCICTWTEETELDVRL